MSDCLPPLASPFITRSHSDFQPPQHRPQFTRQFTAPAHISVASLPLKTLSSLVDLPFESPFFGRVNSSSSDAASPSSSSLAAVVVPPLSGGMPAITHLIDETFHQSKKTRALLLLNEDNNIFSESHASVNSNGNSDESSRRGSGNSGKIDRSDRSDVSGMSKMEQKNEKKLSSEFHHTMRVKEGNSRPFPLLRLAVNELTHALMFLDIHSLLMLGKTNHSLRTLSASDVVWRYTLWRFYCTYHWVEPHPAITTQLMTDQLKLKHLEVYGFAINSKMGWKAAYLKFKGFV